jgi:hypothetical protein
MDPEFRKDSYSAIDLLSFTVILFKYSGALHLHFQMGDIIATNIVVLCTNPSFSK